jgi:hypothetical protein
MVKASAGVFPGAHWDSLAGMLDIMKLLLESSGGLTGIVAKIARFWVSRPWWSLLIFAPWVLLRIEFWWVVFPLSCVYALLEGPKFLWNYYSAPFLGSFWFCASLGLKGKLPQVRNKLPYWVLGSTLLLGSSSIQLEWPSQEVRTLKEEVRQFLPCLGEKGLVTPAFLGLVPMEKVWTERLPRTVGQWGKMDFILVAPEMDRYELTRGQVQHLLEKVKGDSNWQQLDTSCKPIAKTIPTSPTLKPEVVLWVRLKK